MRIKSIVSIVLIVLVVGHIHSAVIEVNSTGGGLGTSELCSLRAAIRAAEMDAPFSACNAGSGDDVIILPNEGNFVFNQVDNNSIGDNALPSVFSRITIEGIDSTLTKSSSSAMMRFFSVGFNASTNESGHLTLNNMTLKGGDIDGSGGAISNRGILNLSHVRMEANHASFEGGALSCSGSNSECNIVSSTLIENSADYAGAIIVNNNSTLTLEKSAILNNQATISNGAVDVGSVYVESGLALISNSTIAGNHANRYGGLFARRDALPFSSPGRIELTYSTVVNNSPIGLVGNIEVKNSIISNNTDGNCRKFTTVNSEGYNHSDDDTCVFDSVGDVSGLAISLEPLLQMNEYIQFYPLAYPSPAIDTADPIDCIKTDQIGTNRPLDGDNDGLAFCDKGAHEMINLIIFINGFE